MSHGPSLLDVPVEKLHAQTLERISRSRPRLISVGRALEAIPRMRSDTILHPGPPITWDNMSDVLRGAITGALLYERVAETEEEARDMAAHGKVTFEPCQDHRAVSPGAGVISPSMPVCVIKNETYSNLSYCTLNEGAGKVMRYGACKADAIDRLEWVEKTLAPVLRQAVAAAGGVDLCDIMTQALQMGDDLHQQTKAATALLIQTLVPFMVKTCQNRETLTQILFFLNGHPPFFQNLAMAAAKSALDAAHGIPGSRVVTAMGHNGTDFGIQISGLDDSWFSSPIEAPAGTFLPGYGQVDAQPIIGDGAMMEAYGLGAFTLANSPAIMLFIGGSVSEAKELTTSMYDITVGESSTYALPALSMKGVPTGIDVERAVEHRMSPCLHVEIMHRQPGGGPIGIALWRCPLEPFEQAAAAMKQDRHT
jgi:hypothetical protein